MLVKYRRIERPQDRGGMQGSSPVRSWALTRSDHSRCSAAFSPSAIGVCPIPLQAAARILAARITSEITESEKRGRFLDTQHLDDVEASRVFDAAVAD